jgi:putative PIN family toxin of toxin-antitoxin system
MTVLVDTNVLLSAALRNRLPERVVLFVATSDDWKWLATPEIFAEYVEVLRRPKSALTEETLSQWSELLHMRTVTVPSPSAALDFAPDPKDAPFLAAALATNADFLVTGDKKLLNAKDVVATRIVNVAGFSAEFQVV